MKRYAAILAAAVLCLCLSACTEQPQETQNNETTNQTTAPVSDPGSSLIPEGSIPLGETVEGMTPGDDVLTPDEMPDEPEADYTIPPQPGQTESY